MDIDQIIDDEIAETKALGGEGNLFSAKISDILSTIISEEFGEFIGSFQDGDINPGRATEIMQKSLHGVINENIFDESIEKIRKRQFGDPSAFIRELYQNASDSYGLTDPKKLIIFSAEEDETHVKIKVRDTGIGMDLATIVKYLLMPYNTTKEFDPHTIGEHGIGSFSVFGMSDLVRIDSTKRGNKRTARCLVYEDDKEKPVALMTTIEPNVLTEDENVDSKYGTEVTLYINKKNDWATKIDMSFVRNFMFKHTGYVDANERKVLLNNEWINYLSLKYKSGSPSTVNIDRLDEPVYFRYSKRFLTGETKETGFAEIDKNVHQVLITQKGLFVKYLKNPFAEGTNEKKYLDSLMKTGIDFWVELPLNVGLIATRNGIVPEHAVEVERACYKAFQNTLFESILHDEQILYHESEELAKVIGDNLERRYYAGVKEKMKKEYAWKVRAAARLSSLALNTGHAIKYGSLLPFKAAYYAGLVPYSIARSTCSTAATAAGNTKRNISASYTGINKKRLVAATAGVTIAAVGIYTLYSSMPDMKDLLPERTMVAEMTKNTIDDRFEKSDDGYVSKTADENSGRQTTSNPGYYEKITGSIKKTIKTITGSDNSTEEPEKTYAPQPKAVERPVDTAFNENSIHSTDQNLPPKQESTYTSSSQNALHLDDPLSSADTTSQETSKKADDPKDTLDKKPINIDEDMDSLLASVSDDKPGYKKEPITDKTEITDSKVEDNKIADTKTTYGKTQEDKSEDKTKTRKSASAADIESILAKDADKPGSSDSTTIGKELSDKLSYATGVISDKASGLYDDASEMISNMIPDPKTRNNLALVSSLLGLSLLGYGTARMMRSKGIKASDIAKFTGKIVLLPIYPLLITAKGMGHIMSGAGKYYSKKTGLYDGVEARKEMIIKQKRDDMIKEYLSVMHMEEWDKRMMNADIVKAHVYKAIPGKHHKITRGIDPTKSLPGMSKTISIEEMVQLFMDKKLRYYDNTSAELREGDVIVDRDNKIITKTIDRLEEIRYKIDMNYNPRLIEDFLTTAGNLARNTFLAGYFLSGAGLLHIAASHCFESIDNPFDRYSGYRKTEKFIAGIPHELCEEVSYMARTLWNHPFYTALGASLISLPIATYFAIRDGLPGKALAAWEESRAQHIAENIDKKGSLEKIAEGATNIKEAAYPYIENASDMLGISPESLLSYSIKGAAATAALIGLGIVYKTNKKTIDRCASTIAEVVGAIGGGIVDLGSSISEYMASREDRKTERTKIREIKRIRKEMEYLGKEKKKEDKRQQRQLDWEERGGYLGLMKDTVSFFVSPFRYTYRASDEYINSAPSRINGMDRDKLAKAVQGVQIGEDYLLFLDSVIKMENILTRATRQDHININYTYFGKGKNSEREDGFSLFQGFNKGIGSYDPKTNTLTIDIRKTWNNDKIRKIDEDLTRTAYDIFESLLYCYAVRESYHKTCTTFFSRLFMDREKIEQEAYASSDKVRLDAIKSLLQQNICLEDEIKAVTSKKMPQMMGFVRPEGLAFVYSIRDGRYESTRREILDQKAYRDDVKGGKLKANVDRIRFKEIFD